MRTYIQVYHVDPSDPESGLAFPQALFLQTPEWKDPPALWHLVITM